MGKTLPKNYVSPVLTYCVAVRIKLHSAHSNQNSNPDNSDWKLGLWLSTG